MKFILIIVISLIYASGCASEEKHFPISQSHSDIFNYLPQETQFVNYINLKTLKETGVWNDVVKPSIENNEESSWLSDFESETGVGLKNGIDEIFIASTWSGNNVIAVIFNEQNKKINNYFMNKEAFVSEEINGKLVHRRKEIPLSYFVFINDSILLVINDSDYLQKVTYESQFVKNKTGLNINTDFISAIEKIEYREHYWMVTNNTTYITGLLGDLSLKSEFREILNSVKDVSLSAKLLSSAEIILLWTCKNSKSAFLLQSALEGAVSFELLSKKNAALNKVLNKMKINRISNNVNVKIKLDSIEIRELKNLSEINDTLKKI